MSDQRRTLSGLRKICFLIASSLLFISAIFLAGCATRNYGNQFDTVISDGKDAIQQMETDRLCDENVERKLVNKYSRGIDAPRFWEEDQYRKHEQRAMRVFDRTKRETMNLREAICFGSQRATFKQLKNQIHQANIKTLCRPNMPTEMIAQHFETKENLLKEEYGEFKQKLHQERTPSGRFHDWVTTGNIQADYTLIFKGEKQGRVKFHFDHIEGEGWSLIKYIEIVKGRFQRQTIHQDGKKVVLLRSILSKVR